MNMLSKTVLFAVIALFLVAGTAMANFIEITINDNRQSGTNSWHANTDEDQEVEPGMVATQVWDLEGFYLDGNNLAMVGGWDFVNGVLYGGHTYLSGDIFIDITGDAQYGLNPTSVENFGYEYVFDMDWAGYTYNVYELDSTSTLKSSYDYNSPESDPYSFDYSNDLLVGPGTFSYFAGLSDADTDFFGGTHYMVSGFDLGFLNPGTEFIAHFTMECGNDNLMGRGTTSVPEPANMLLLGTGLIVIAGLGRKRFFKK